MPVALLASCNIALVFAGESPVSEFDAASVIACTGTATRVAGDNAEIAATCPNGWAYSSKRQSAHEREMQWVGASGRGISQTERDSDHTGVATSNVRHHVPGMGTPSQEAPE